MQTNEDPVPGSISVKKDTALHEIARMGGAIIVNCPELDNCCLLTLEYSFNLIPYLINLSPNNIFLTFDLEPSRMKVLLDIYSDPK